jgi:CRISPR-associated protein Csd1
VGLLERADPDEIRKLLTLRGDGWKSLEPNEFYFLAVKGNGGRLLVSQWIHESLRTILDHVAGWFEGLQMVDCFTGEVAGPPKMWLLLSVLARDEPPARMALELTRRALLGQPVGLSVLHAALHRMRLEQGKGKLNAVRTGLIRLLVNDEIEKTGGSKMDKQLNAGEMHPAYLCGRLLAQFVSLQYQASGTDVNQTVADRYYSLASTQPRLAFPKLEDLGLKHLRKVRRESPGAAVNIERQMDEIRKQLGEVFPEPFSLVDQGRFALGFHHERAAILQRAKEAKDKKEKQAKQNEQGEMK